LELLEGLRGVGLFVGDKSLGAFELGERCGGLRSHRMMGGGFFDNAYPYNVYGAQPRGGFYRPRASEYDQFWYPSRMRHPASPNESRGEGERTKARARNVEESPVRRNVRTVVVEDGGEKEAESRKAPPQAPQSQKTPQGRKGPAVRFENSDAAASKIQSVYRGYSVRRTEPLKHLRVICKVKAELEELMRKSHRPEEMEKFREDPQVRLRWTEGVMSLILRLDSLQGVHPVVRDIRKSVAKELICFQERIDSLADGFKENLVVENDDSVEEDSNVEAINEDIAIDEDTNVPDLETQKETALWTEDSSDSSASPVPENLTKVVTSLVEKIDIADDLQGKSGESSILEAEPPIQMSSEKCQESDSTIDSEANPTMSMVNEVPFALEPSSMVVDTSEAVANDKVVNMSKMERVPTEVSSAMDLKGENEGSPPVEDIELGEDKKGVVAFKSAMNECDMDRISAEGISVMDVEVENKGSPQVEGGERGVEEKAVAVQDTEETTFLPTAQSIIPENVNESLIRGDNDPEVANATEGTECTGLPAGELEEAADGYRGDDARSTEDEELSPSPIEASNNAMVVANQPSWTSLISDSRQGDAMTLSEPQTTTDDSSLSDRALMLQILEENRKLKAVVGEVLQWGKQQNEVINNLASRVKQLEGDVSNAKLLKDCIHSNRKRTGNIGSIAGPIGERERVVRRLENGRNGRWGHGRQINYINGDEQWPSSTESEDFF
jgi:hypothetical protein